MTLYLILGLTFVACFIAAGLIIWKMQANQAEPTTLDVYAPQLSSEAEPTLPAPSGGPFQLTVEDVFNIRGRGTVVTGRVANGQIRVGDVVLLNGERRVKITGVEMFAKILEVAQEGDNVGLLLQGLNKEDVQKGDVLSK